jgi:plastocyanin
VVVAALAGPLAAVATAGASGADEGFAPRATTVQVRMVDDAYAPAEVEGVVGHTGVTWRNQGTVFHTATTSRRPRWFDVVLDEGESGGTVLSFAGTFPYLCRYHAQMRGTLRVVPRLEPPGGTAGDRLTVVLAAEDPAADGFAFDVQRRRDAHAWVDVGRVETAEEALRFARPGTYAIRARLVDLARERAGRWSPPVVAVIAV